MNTPIKVHYLGAGEASEIGELLECIWSNGSQGHRAEGGAAVRLYSKKRTLILTCTLKGLQNRIYQLNAVAVMKNVESVHAFMK